MIVLDTHTWWWAISEPTRLSLRATEAINKTPPDRMIVATARIHHVPLVTKDRKIRDYPHVQTIW